MFLAFIKNARLYCSSISNAMIFISNYHLTFTSLELPAATLHYTFPSFKMFWTGIRQCRITVNSINNTPDARPNTVGSTVEKKHQTADSTKEIWKLRMQDTGLKIYFETY